MNFPGPTLDSGLTDASPALPDAHTGYHNEERVKINNTTAELVAHEASTTAHNLAAQLAAYQPLDSDLTAIAALTTTSYGRAFLALADAAAGRTALALGTAALSASGDFQPVDSDLTAIAALSTTSFGRSLLTAADAAAARTAIGAGTGSGDALVANPLSQFAATTSAQLRGVLSDETGTGAAVFATSPALVTPTGIVKGDVGLGNVDNTADTAKPVSTAAQTALDLKANIASPTFTGTVTVPSGAALGTPSALVLTNATGFPASGVTAATYGSSSAIPVITVGADGRATTITTAAIADSPAVLVLTRSTFK